MMNARSRPRFGPVLALIAALALIAGAAMAISPLIGARESIGLLSQTTTQVAGNTSCAAQGYSHGLKIEPAPFAGNYAFPGDPGNTLTITSVDDVYIDWTSTLGIDAVIVKAGNASSIYTYAPEATSDEQLHGYYNGSIPDTSHVEFCYDYELDIAKTVQTAFTRTWTWTIDKSVDRPRIDMFVGEPAQDATYTVGVVRTATDSDFTASGTITITNPDPLLAVEISVADSMGGIDPTLDCPTNVVPAGGSVSCSYTADFGDTRPAPGDNVATVSTDGAVGGGTATAPYAFGDGSSNITYAGPASIDVTDDNGDAWTFSDTGSVSYAVAFSCNEDEGFNGNTATIQPDGPSDSANVDVFCHELEVSKDADTSYVRTYEWTIDKSVSRNHLDLFEGDSAPVTWTVEVAQTGHTDSAWSVAGAITISNPAPIDVRIDSVLDTIDGDIAAPVDCGVALPYRLEAGATLTCTYETGLPDASPRENSAIVSITTPNGASTAFEATASVVFGKPTTHVDASIDIADSDGHAWSTSSGERWSYTESFACDESDGQHVNTATITSTGQDDSAALNVDCWSLDVTKDAVTTYTRTFPWTIDKAVDRTQMDLRYGDIGVANYTLEVRKGEPIDSDWMVSGTITVTNSTPMVATLAVVTDEIDDLPVVVTCPVDSFPYDLAPGASLTCTYQQALPSAEPRVNIATATLLFPGGETRFSGSANVVFGEPTTIVNGEIDVADNNLPGGPVVFGDDGTVTYAVELPCVDVEGLEHTYYTHSNTATIIETGASASVDVLVDCWNLSITKSVETSFVRTWQWEITKSAAPNTLAMFSGDTGTVDYAIGLTRTGYVDSGWEAHGTITVYNEAPIPAVVTDVTDLVMSGNDVVSVVKCNVEFPVVMDPETSFTCRYDADLPGEGDYIDRSVAVYENTPPGGATEFSYDLPFDFSGAVIYEVDQEIHVTDTNGSEWTFTDSGQIGYERTFACGADAGSHPNTATIVETGQSADASVDVLCYDLAVTKTASTSLTRQWTWTIDKTSTLSNLTLSSPDQVILVTYDVTTTTAFADSDWAVSGAITITNPAPRAALVAGVADVISGDIAGTITCDTAFPVEIPANGSLTCTYTAPLPDSGGRVNTATATLVNHDYTYDEAGNELATTTGTTDSSGVALVSFDEPAVTQIDECISVDDDQAGLLGDVCASSAPKTFTYTSDVGPYQACGQYEFVNTATFVTNDTGATGADSWVILADVPCNGCTLTLGYWRTHSIYGPAPTDDGWYAIGDIDGDGISEGPDETFFKSGKTWLQILNTPTSGNQYLNLAKQYIAARLNLANGVVAPPASVSSAITSATAYFSSQPAGIPAGKITKTLIQAQSVLDQFNNGLIGPGHCSE